MNSFDCMLPQFTFQSFTQTAVIPNFTFYIDKKTYHCHTLLICSISNVIKSQLSTEKPAYEFRFRDIKDPHLYFKVFISLLNGESQNIDSSNSFFLNYVANQLDIKDLMAATFPYVNVQITTNNVFDILSKNAECNIKCQNVLSFIYQNWRTFENDERIFNLSLDSLKFIFGGSGFKPSSRDWLFTFVAKLVEVRGKEFSELYLYCNFPDISSHQMINIIGELALDTISIDFLNAVEARFIKEVEREDSSNECDEYEEEEDNDDEINHDFDLNNEMMFQQQVNLNQNLTFTDQQQVNLNQNSYFNQQNSQFGQPAQFNGLQMSQINSINQGFPSIYQSEQINQSFEYSQLGQVNNQLNNSSFPSITQMNQMNQSFPSVTQINNSPINSSINSPINNQLNTQLNQMNNTQMNPNFSINDQMNPNFSINDQMNPNFSINDQMNIDMYQQSFPTILGNQTQQQNPIQRPFSTQPTMTNSNSNSLISNHTQEGVMQFYKGPNSIGESPKSFQHIQQQELQQQHQQNSFQTKDISPNSPPTSQNSSSLSRTNSQPQSQSQSPPQSQSQLTQQSSIHISNTPNTNSNSYKQQFPNSSNNNYKQFRPYKSSSYQNDTDLLSKVHVLPYKDKRDEFKGIFSYFKSETNQHSSLFKKYVDVDCGGDNNGSKVYNLFNYHDIWTYHWNTFSMTEGSLLKNAWLTIRFPYHKLTLTNYTFASTNIVKGATHRGLQPKSWTIEASDDMKNWILISKVIGTTELSDSKDIATFSTDIKNSSSSFSCFRIKLIENGAKPIKKFANQLKLNAIEFYGTLTPINS
ncbi:hypothetical protein TRFO_29268 [Tritrichomonas foetus]|uniref:BTB domain-containing protein n=1 Tax=Tritrichomonas foetus TaxID=1144522 RepID=A0A1J4JWH2_9EUKA|nr:hypothetical protein TRFO_29268 [Tritrichomonas foetus]|eukprot:OHT03347.1 hypothetical protein TRFO_29268 [Tritrichomonas foetus]